MNVSGFLEIIGPQITSNEEIYLRDTIFLSRTFDFSFYTISQIEIERFFVCVCVLIGLGLFPSLKTAL